MSSNHTPEILKSRFGLAPLAASRAPLHVRLSRALDQTAKYIAMGIASCLAGQAAARLHEELSRCSDAELERRGMTREDIARRACGLIE